MEMIGVLTKYMDIDETKIEMDLDHDEKEVALVANIPVLRIKRGAAEIASSPVEDEALPPPSAAPSREKHDRNKRHKS